MKILLVLNKPNREIPIMESIRRGILALKPDSEVEIREMCVPGFKRFVFKFRPDVVMTFPFTCVGFSRWYYLFKFLFGSKIISFRAEGVIDFSNQYNVEWATGFDTYGKDLVDYEIFWGEKVASAIGNKLLEQNKISSLDRIKICGYPRLEKYFIDDNNTKPELSSRIAERLNGYSREKVILFITGFHLANYTREHLFGAKDLDAENKIDELLEAVEISRRFRSEWIANIIMAARDNPDCLIVSKKHPIEKKEDYEAFQGIDNILFVYEDVEMQDIVQSVGVLFHYGSTALVDAYLSKIPAIYVYSKSNKEWYSDLGWPSMKRIEVHEIPAMAKVFFDGNCTFQLTPEIGCILKDIFNIEPGKPYNPSHEIAKIILGADPCQRVTILDKYLWYSVASILSETFSGTFRYRSKLLLGKIRNVIHAN